MESQVLEDAKQGESAAIKAVVGMERTALAEGNAQTGYRI